MTSLSEIHDAIKDKYPHSEIYLFDEIIWGNIEGLIVEIRDWTTIDISKDGKSLNKEILDIITTIDTLPQNQVMAFAIETLLSNLEDSAGFTGEVVAESEITSNMNYLYEELRKTLVVPSNTIHLLSFGAKHVKNMHTIKQHNISDLLKFKCDEVFDARIIGSKKPGGLADLNGTDKIIQTCIESGHNFEKVLRNIVKSIEVDGNRIIGIYCTAGHHRSVALVELMKMHLYPGAKITHIHIRKR